MESVNKLSKMIEGWLKPVPHLPVKAQKWIAVNVWWIELIGLVCLCFAGLAAISLLFAAFGLAGATFGFLGVSVFNAFDIISILVSFLSLGLGIVIMAMAISPLKNLNKKGWDLLFLSILANAVYVIFNSLKTFNIFGFLSGIVGGAIGIAIAIYFLFEIKSYFVAKK